MQCPECWKWWFSSDFGDADRQHTCADCGGALVRVDVQGSD